MFPGRLPGTGVVRGACTGPLPLLLKSEIDSEGLLPDALN